VVVNRPGPAPPFGDESIHEWSSRPPSADFAAGGASTTGALTNPIGQRFITHGRSDELAGTNSTGLNAEDHDTLDNERVLLTPDELCTTPAERAALTALRELAGADSVMERHCHRQFLIAERLVGERPYDRELVLCACWLHDAGVYIDSSAPYVTEAGLLAARVVEPFAWETDRRQRLLDACEQHHAPRSRMALGLEVELLRQSDLVDVSAGLVNFGIDRAWLRALFRRVPRSGFIPLLGRIAVHELRSRPMSLTRVFIEPDRTRL
jgi:hypothetical protein